MYQMKGGHDNDVVRDLQDSGNLGSMEVDA